MLRTVSKKVGQTVEFGTSKNSFLITEFFIKGFLSLMSHLSLMSLHEKNLGTLGTIGTNGTRTKLHLSILK
jgi:hypothetical protein